MKIIKKLGGCGLLDSISIAVVLILQFMPFSDVRANALEQEWSSLEIKLKSQQIPTDLYEYDKLFNRESSSDSIKFFVLLWNLERRNLTDDNLFAEELTWIDTILDSKELLLAPVNVGQTIFRRRVPTSGLTAFCNRYLTKVTQAIEANDKELAMKNLYRLEQLTIIGCHNIDQSIAALQVGVIIENYVDAIELLYLNQLLSDSETEILLNNLAAIEELYYSKITLAMFGDFVQPLDIADYLLKDEPDNLSSLSYQILMKEKIFIAEFVLKFNQEIMVNKLLPVECAQFESEFKDDSDFPKPVMMLPLSGIYNYYDFYIAMFDAIAELRLAQIALNPELEERLLDPFSGEKFKKIDNVIYSIGGDGTDNQASSSAEVDSSSIDDISFKLK